ncbi:MAG: CsgG/HfaB family protein [Fibrobacterota bacterium]
MKKRTLLSLLLLTAAGLGAQVPASPPVAPENVTEQKAVTADEKSVPPAPAQPAAAKPAAPSSIPVQTQAPATVSPSPSVTDAAAPEVTPLIKTAKANFDKGNYAGTDKAADLALSISPNNYDAVKYKAFVALKLGNLEAAGQHFTLALTANNKDAEFDYYLGGYYEAVKDFLAAEKTFLRHCEYGLLEPFTPKLRDCAARVRPLADRARARLAISQEASISPDGLKSGSVAVAAFANTGSDKGLDPLSKGLSEMIATDLSQVERFTLLERARMQALADEMALGQTGLLEEKNSERFGRLAGAERVVAGSFSGNGKDAIELSAAVSDAKTGWHRAIPAQKGAMKDLFKIEKDLVFAILKEMGIVLTEAERKKVEIVATENVLAFLAYSKGLDAQDRGDFSAAQAYYTEAVKLDPAYSQARASRDNAATLSAAPRPADVQPVMQAAPVPIFTVGGLNFTAGPAALHSADAVNAAFMPEKSVSAGALGRTLATVTTAMSPATPPSAPAAERNAYIEANNIGFSSDTKIIRVEIPIP